MANSAARVRDFFKSSFRALRGLPRNLEEKPALHTLVKVARDSGIPDPERTVLPHLLPMKRRMGLGRSMFRQLVFHALAHENALSTPLHRMVIDHPRELVAAQEALWWHLAEKKVGMTRNRWVSSNRESYSLADMCIREELRRLEPALAAYAAVHART